MNTVQSIQRLSKNVTQKLRASFIIVDIVQAVEELVYNSIDANATDISIHIDFENYCFSVQDNGTYKKILNEQDNFRPL